MNTQPTYQALTLEERLQMEKDARVLKWQAIKARLQGQIKPAQPTTVHTCGGMLFELETGAGYCLNCGEL